MEEDNRENILCSWQTKYAKILHEVQNAGCWHYALKKGKIEWGETIRTSWRFNSPTRSGMDKLSKMRGCANGRSIRFEPEDKHIALGYVRYQDTKEVFRFPTDLKCMYCYASPNHIIERTRKEVMEQFISHLY